MFVNLPGTVFLARNLNVDQKLRSKIQGDDDCRLSAALFRGRRRSSCRLPTGLDGAPKNSQLGTGRAENYHVRAYLRAVELDAVAEGKMETICMFMLLNPILTLS
jgi:hypothetical protein